MSHIFSYLASLAQRSLGVYVHTELKGAKAQIGFLLVRDFSAAFDASIIFNTSK